MVLGRVFKGVLVLFLAAFLVFQCSDAEARRGKGKVPKIILEGLEAYKEGGPEIAIRAWLKGGPLEGKKVARTQSAMLRKIQAFYGNYVDYEIISVNPVSPTAKIVYLQISFEKGPIFAYFLCYRKQGVWIIPEFIANTKPDVVLPNHLFD